MYRLLIVDDEPHILSALRRIFTRRDALGVHYLVETFDNPEAALVRARQLPIDLVLSDYRMPEMDGVTFLQAFRKIQPDAMRLILSGYADLQAVLSALNEAEIYRFICKPWQDYELRTTIAQALSYRNLILENQQLADIIRVTRGKLSAQDAELRRLEREHPGITQVEWTEDGAVILDDLD
ncbi:response regulator [Ampullimonas aquatilis]|uniref:response regulator n=1 Tax=Ampullimonas aquatilis TaxID=1341549 RepID=UPI003C7491DD